MRIYNMTAPDLFVNNPKTRKTSTIRTQRRDTTCTPDCCRVNRPVIAIPRKAPRTEFVPIGKIREIPDSVKNNPLKNFSEFVYSNFSSCYKSEPNKGISYKNARRTDICLAKYAQAVAEEIDTLGACYTGVKYAMWSAGVINDYGDMPKGSAHNSLSYFSEHPERFRKVTVKSSDLKNLPAGRIIVYTKEGKDGHIAITNGKGQEMSDCTDNMKWLEKQGKGASFSVYELTDGWSYNERTKKLEFHGK